MRNYHVRSGRTRRGCRKARYNTFHAASKAMKHIRENYTDRQSLPTRVYECGMCRGWHLTSKERTSRLTLVPNESYTPWTTAVDQLPAVEACDVCGVWHVADRHLMPQTA